MYKGSNMKNTEAKEIKKSKGYIVLSAVTGFFLLLYLLWRIFFTIPDIGTYGWLAFGAGIALVVAEGVSVLEALIHYIDLNRQFEPPMPVIPQEWYPEVDVMIATHNEDVELLFKTVNGCVRMEYPDKEKVHIHICDDTNRKEVKELADRMGVNYFGMTENKDAKAGNLNHAIGKTSAPLIVTFDADMIPNSDFLIETVPYFFLPKMKQDEEGNWVERTEDEIEEGYKIGFIQTPQSFYNPDLFQYNLYSEGKIPNEQDYFFRQVNIGKNRTNSPIYAGSNTVISREALAEVGGICTGTITEDFETGLLIEGKGYTCYAVDKLLAKGLAPITIKNLIKQRERWARGCIYSLRRVHLLWNPQFKFGLKMSYFACRIYWGSFTRRFLYILSPILFVLFGIPVMICDFWELLCIWLPSYLLYGVTLKKISGDIRNTRWSNIIDTTIFPYLLLPIWAEVLFIRKTEFHVTSKKKTKEEENDKIMALPHIVLLFLSVCALLLSAKDLLLYRAFGSLVVIYWLLVNSGSLIMAIFFMIGRKNERMTERFSVSLPVEVHFDDKVYYGTVVDVSEGGLSFLLDNAVYLPYENDENAVFYIQDRDYYAKLSGKIVTVKRSSHNENWQYCVSITEIDQRNREEYLQIIYDREHTLPKKLSNGSGYFEDISSNLLKRCHNPEGSKRKTARIMIHEICELAGGVTVILENYNFEYVRLMPTEAGDILPKEVVLYPENSYAMHCEKSHINPNVYKILNWRELMENTEFAEKVSAWEENEKK